MAHMIEVFTKGERAKLRRVYEQLGAVLNGAPKRRRRKRKAKATAKAKPAAAKAAPAAAKPRGKTYPTEASEGVDGADHD